MKDVILDFLEIVFIFSLIIFIAFCSSGCVSTQTPIVIRDVPKCDVSADMNIQEYMNSSTNWAVEISAYIQELINQIKHKANYIDLRK